MLLQLYIAGSNLQIVSTGNYPIWSQDISGDTTVITTDLCEGQDKTNSQIIGYSVELYNIIETSLKHFHNQIENYQTTSSGDVSDTTPYSEGMTDYYSSYMSSIGCNNDSSTPICKGQPQVSDFYSSYKTTTYTDFSKPNTYSLQAYAPADITKFRVLLIGAGGGGGGGASGKYNNKGHDQAGGGGGGGGGGGIAYSPIYQFTNNYKITVGTHGEGGSGGSNKTIKYDNDKAHYARVGNSGGHGNYSILYDSSNSEIILAASGGNAGNSGYVASGNSTASGYQSIGTQGTGGSGGTGNSGDGNSGSGGKLASANGGNGGESLEWSSPNETTITPLKGGAGGNCPMPGNKNGVNTSGNRGSAGSDGFVRVYWIP